MTADSLVTLRHEFTCPDFAIRVDNEECVIVFLLAGASLEAPEIEIRDVMEVTRRLGTHALKLATNVLESYSIKFNHVHKRLKDGRSETQLVVNSWLNYTNLENLTAEDLDEWLKAHPKMINPWDTEAWIGVFPLNPIGAWASYNRLVKIAELRKGAYALRMNGDIQKALYQEAGADRLYSQIPEHLRAY
jgi:hypothetical protein